MQSGTFNRSIRFLIAAGRRQPAKNGASLAIMNANVITMDENDTLAQAIAIFDDRIIKVGTENEIRPLIGEATEVINLDGRTVVPGFINAHEHTILGGVGPAFSVGYSRSIEEMMGRIAGYTRQVPKGELIQCDKVDPVFPRFGSLHIKEQRWPTRAELDRVAPDHYLILGLNHGSIVNSKLLDLVLSEGPSNIGGIVKDPNTGEPNGILTEAEPPLVGASRVVRGLIHKHWPTPMTDEMLEQHDIAFAEQAVSVGFTTLHIAGTDEFETRFLLSNTLPARFVPYFDILDYFSSVQPNFSDENLEKNLATIKNLSEECNARIGTKFLNDGDIVPPDNTGALFEPYINQPENRGILYLQGEDLRRVVSKVHEAGLQLAIHCCGDRCLEEVLNAYEYALKKAPRADHRHRIEHGELATDAQIARAARLGIAFVMSPIFLHYDDCTPFLGEERMKRLHRNKSLMEAGVLLACGSDWGDVIATDPFLGIHIMVNHQNHEERISVRDALRAYTINGAKVGFEEKDKGSLEPGKLADLVVLSDDIYKVDPEKIRNLQVALTMVGGRIMFINDRLFRNYP